MTPQTHEFTTVDNFLQWVDRVFRDREREFVTAMILEGVDDDALEAMLVESRAAYAQRRAELPAQIRACMSRAQLEGESNQ
jgi:hypothetical protein